MSSTILSIPLEKVKPGQAVSNDRRFFDPLKIRELAVSIARDGLAQPITVRPMPDGHYEIVAGERRYRACCVLRDHGCTFTSATGQRVTLAPGDFAAIPAIVRDLSDHQAAAIMLAENTSRADLNPIEEARAYQSRLDRFRATPEKVAEMAGVSPELVRRRLSLLSLIPDAQSLVQSGDLPLGHAETLTPLDANRQRIAVRIFSEAPSGLTLRQFKHIVNDLLQEQQSQTLFDLEAFWVEQVQSNQMPRRGKKAYLTAPTRKDLPPVKRSTRWSAAEVIDRYIADLLTTGHREEAAAIGNIYHTLVRHNYMAAPIQSAVPDDGSDYDRHEASADAPSPSPSVKVAQRGEAK